MRNLIFLCGPSGAGKSTIGKAFAETKDWLFLEADIAEDEMPDQKRDTMRLLGIRDEWNEFWDRSRATPLIRALKMKAANERKGGAILSLPGLVYFEEEKLDALRGKVESIVLFASPEQCLKAFLAREKRTGRNLPLWLWVDHNRNVFHRLEDPKFSAQMVLTFGQDDTRRTNAEIFAEIEKRLLA